MATTGEHIIYAGLGHLSPNISHDIIINPTASEGNNGQSNFYLSK